MTEQQDALARGMEWLSALFCAAEEAFKHGDSNLWMDYGYYDDGTIADPDLHEIEISMDTAFTPWYRVTIPQGWTVFLEQVQDRIEQALWTMSDREVEETI